MDSLIPRKTKSSKLQNQFSSVFFFSMTYCSILWYFFIIFSESTSPKSRFDFRDFSYFSKFRRSVWSILNQIQDFFQFRIKFFATQYYCDLAFEVFIFLIFTWDALIYFLYLCFPFLYFMSFFALSFSNNLILLCL